MKIEIIIILSILFFNSCIHEDEKTCYLTGEVIDRDSKIIILKKQTDDIRNYMDSILIDSLGKFSYNLHYDIVEAYELVFKDEFEKGSWKPILFFPDSDTIKFKLYPTSRNYNNKIEGSILSLEDLKFNQVIHDNFYNKYLYWVHIKDSLKMIDEIKTDYYNAINDSINKMLNYLPIFELQYTKRCANLYGYSQLLEILRTESYRKLFDIDTLKDYCNFFKQKFPDHPYNEIAQFRLNGLVNIKEGGYYENFTANDSSDVSFTLSNIISQNKYTLLDLWAPWCSPCIRKSKNLVPIYIKYKDSGFNVIGVIGGINSKDQFLYAVRKYKYPWVLLSEINNEHNIWEKYNISHSGGSQFLINQYGKILAINPSPEELEKIISEN